MEQQLNQPNKPSFLVSIILLTAIVIGGITYFWQKNSNEKVISNLEQKIFNLEQEISTVKIAAQPAVIAVQDAIQSDVETDAQPAATAVQDTQSDKIDDWKTYSNTRYSYTIKYPSNWYVDTKFSENGFTQRGPVEDNEFMGGDTHFNNYPNLSGYNRENPAPKDSLSVTLIIYKISPDITYDQFISTEHYGYDKKENITVNGIRAVRLSGVVDDSPSITVVNTFLKVGDKMFWFNYSGDPLTQGMKDTANKVISSFTLK